MKPPLAARPAARTSGIGSRPAERERSDDRQEGRRRRGVAGQLAEADHDRDASTTTATSGHAPIPPKAAAIQTARPVRSIASASVSPRRRARSRPMESAGRSTSRRELPTSSRRGRGQDQHREHGDSRRRRGRGSCLRGRDAGPPAAAKEDRTRSTRLARQDPGRESRSISAMPPGISPTFHRNATRTRIAYVTGSATTAIGTPIAIQRAKPGRMSKVSSRNAAVSALGRVPISVATPPIGSERDPRHKCRTEVARFRPRVLGFASSRTDRPIGRSRRVVAVLLVHMLRNA